MTMKGISEGNYTNCVNCFCTKRGETFLDKSEDDDGSGKSRCSYSWSI